MPSKKSTAPNPPASAESETKTLDEQKAGALNLFEQEEKMAARKGSKPMEKGSVYGHLGKEGVAKKIAAIKSSQASTPKPPGQKNQASA